ncbi:MAG: DNA recombination protein RmuC [bacterium]
MEILTLFLLAVLIIFVIYLTIAVTRRKEPPFTDLAVMIEKSAGNTRQELSDRVSKSLQEFQDRVQKQLADGRQEQNTNLGGAIEKLEKKFDSLQSANQQHLETIRDKVDGRLIEIGDRVQGKLDESFEKVQGHLKAAESHLQSVGIVGDSISELNNLLKLPHLRGSFGETRLEDLLADLLPAELYDTQVSVDGSQERVDAVVKLPNARLPIDSKFPREQVLPMFEESAPDKLKAARENLERVLRNEARQIAAKYIKPENGTTDIALMFLPSETLYFETIRNVPLCEELRRCCVFPVSPNTLAITLRAISLSYSYYEMAQGVRKTIDDIQKAKKHFVNFERKFEEIKRSLIKAQDSYGVAETHLRRFSGSVVKLTGAPMDALDEGKSEELGQLPEETEDSLS